MRIAHVTSSLAVEAGGVARAVIDSAYALAKSGVDVDLISYDHGRFDFPWAEHKPASLNVILCNGKSSKWIVGDEMMKAWSERLPQADVVHLHGMWEPMAASVARMARAIKKPYICSVHGMLDPWSVAQRRLKKALYFSLVEKSRLAHSAAMHFTAKEEELKADRGGWIPSGVRRVVIPLIMDLAPYNNLPSRTEAHAMFPNVPTDVPWVLFLSRIHEKKGLDLLIEAMAKAATGRAHLVIAGSGDEAYVKSLKSRIETLGFNGRVHFVGTVAGKNKIALYRRADMLVIPTSQENFGLVFPESLACETPVLLTRGVDIHPEIVDSQGGMLIERDPEDIAAKIGILLGDSASAQKRGQRGREWVFKTLEPGVIANRWIETYQSCIAR